MSTKTQRAVIKRPGQAATVEMIEPGLASLQALVEGYIDVAIRGFGFFADGDLTAYVNDEGAVREPPMAPNVHRPTDGWPLLGPIVVTKTNADGDDVSLSEADAEVALRFLASLPSAGKG